MKFTFKNLIIAIALLALAGCKKLDIAPTDRFSDLTFWTVDVNVNNALNAARKATFNADANAPDTQEGTITYVYQVK